MKEWLYLAFFPQEDPVQLRVIRSMLTPFLQSVSRALPFELKNPYNWKEDLLREIIQNAPAENSVSTHLQILRNVQASWSQASDTLKLEFDQLLDLQ